MVAAGSVPGTGCLLLSVVKFLVLWSDHGADQSELLHLKETVDLREEAGLLHKDVQASNSKQDAMTKVITGVQSAVAALGSQLSAINEVLKTLSVNASNTVDVPSSGQQPAVSRDRAPVIKDPTEETEEVPPRPLTEELSLAVEQEKTMQCAALTGLLLRLTQGFVLLLRGLTIPRFNRSSQVRHHQYQFLV